MAELKTAITIEAREEFCRLAEKIDGAATRLSRRLPEARRKLAVDNARAGRAGRLALGAPPLAGGISRLGALIRGGAAGPMEAAAEVARSRGRLAALGMSEAGIDEVERTGRALSRQYAGIETAGFLGSAYDVRSAMGELSETDVAPVAGIAAELGRAAGAAPEEMTSAVSGAYGVFKEPLYGGLEDVAFVERFGAQLSKAMEMFRKTGGQMEQGIESMGAGLSLSGITMPEQLAALGKLQDSMDAGEAGAALRSMRQGAVEAHEAFREAGLDIAVIDEAAGNLRPIASVLDGMERVFGEVLDDSAAARIKQAFGRDEALRVFEAMWAGGKELRAAARELEAATMADARRRARARDDNLGGALDRIRRRRTELAERLAAALEPALRRLEPHLDRAIGWLETASERWPDMTAGITTLVGAIGLLAAPAANLVAVFDVLMRALRQLGRRSLQTAGELQGAGGGGPVARRGRIRGLGRKVADRAKDLPSGIKGLGGGLMGRVGELGKGLAGRIGEIVKGVPGLLRGKGLAGRALGLLKGKAGLLGAGIGALSIGSTLLDDKLSGREKAAEITEDAGGIGGALAGGALGAAIGTAVLPGIGTAVGGIVGSIAGGLGGGALGAKLGSLFRGESEEEVPVGQRSLAKAIGTAAAGLALTLPAAAGTSGAPLEPAPVVAPATTEVGAPPLSGLTLPPYAASAGAMPGASIDQGIHIQQLTIQQQPGEDAGELAERVIREIEHRRQVRSRAALYDDL
ncbi:MAG: phage tail tape measure protein [Bryobacterales bacterium]|nr:phage tail tape measure protein [Bryobacterales bacterium]MDE0293129.1 phage tail tape measure protein [Bryobacterales bacterium]